MYSSFRLIVKFETFVNIIFIYISCLIKDLLLLFLTELCTPRTQGAWLFFSWKPTSNVKRKLCSRSESGFCLIHKWATLASAGFEILFLRCMFWQLPCLAAADCRLCNFSMSHHGKDLTGDVKWDLTTTNLYNTTIYFPMVNIKIFKMCLFWSPCFFLIF